MVATMKSHILLITALLLFASCTNELDRMLETRQMTFSAFIEDGGSATKTSLGPKEGGIYKTYWSENDKLDVFCDGQGPFNFDLTEGVGSSYGHFAGQGGGSRFVAIYPSGLEASVDGKELSFNLPQTQQYAKGSFGEGAFPMIAVGNNQNFEFKNLCSVIRFSLKGDYTVKSLTFSPNDENIKVSGKASVRTDFDGTPELVMDKEASNKVFLECNVEINKEEATDFYIVIPAQEYKGGFTLKICTTSGMNPVIEKSSTKDFTAERSILYKVEELELEDAQSTGDPERDALIALYNATDGDHWTNNTNWCSDKPLNEWYGIGTMYDGTAQKVLYISLSNNNLSGNIPDEIGNLKQLTSLSMSWNNLTGELPLSLFSLSKLEYITLIGTNGLCGTLPENLGNLVNLQSLTLSINKFEGEIPHSIGNLEKLHSLYLENNNFSGELPVEMGNLKNMEWLLLNNNSFSGGIPKELGNMTKLQDADFKWNSFSGQLPEELFNLPSLKRLDLHSNRLSGTFPKSMTNMTSLVSIDLRDNRFSGPVPEEILSWKIWKGAWGFFVAGNDFTEEDVMSYHIPAPEFQVTDINGNIWDNSIYSKNKYTVLFEWWDAGLPSGYVDEWSSLLLPLYADYHDKGLEIISWSPDDKSTVQQYAGNWPWITLHSPEYPEEGETRNNVSDLDGFNGWNYPGGFIPSVTIIDSTGIVVKSSDFDGCLEPTVDFLKQCFEGTVHDWYESTDYSADGTIEILQQAAKGNGIDIVLMGDAYSDRLIADGTYDATMRKVMDVFFTQEPYKTFRDYFNVYDVRAVSKNEVYETGASTVLSTGFGEGTLVYGNNNRCINYALKAVGDDRMDNTLIITICNTNKYAGTCYMLYPETTNDWGSGTSVAYFPLGTDDDMFAGLIHHEAGGHGFSKLLDEYAYEENGQIPQGEIDNIKQQITYGWGKNLDFTSDPAEVKWSRFLTDDRYQYDGLGVFEGGATYWTGVWRPTEYSLMRYNTGNFNAPSRESIYYRIHKLAYGADWQYDYEDFVKYDAINRATGSMSSTFRLGVSKLPEPTASPVVVGKTWREALEEAPSAQKTDAPASSSKRQYNRSIVVENFSNGKM